MRLVFMNEFSDNALLRFLEVAQDTIMLMLQRYNALYQRRLFIDLDYGLARRHHQLHGNAGVIALPGVSFGRRMMRKKFFHLMLFSFGHDELVRVQGRPRMVLIQLFPKRFYPIVVHFKTTTPLTDDSGGASR